ncbi:hypothetical protein QUC31_012363 [Theobroma cacao]
MGLQLTVLVMKVCITLSAMSVDGSSVRVSWSPRGLPTETPTVHPIGPGQPPLIQPDPAPSLTRTPPSSGRTRNGELAAAPSSKVSHHSSSINHSPTKALHPQPVLKPPSIAVAPSASSFGSPARDWMHGPASSPSLSFYKHDYAMNGFGDSAPEPSYLIHQPADSQQVPAVSPSQYSIPSWVSPAPALSPTDPSRHFNMPTLQPAISPVGSSLENTKGSPAPVVMALPPPPPNKELAQEIAASVRLNHSQVRIMGANAASQELEKSTVLINLVPWEVKFDSSTSLLVYKKFWNRHVFIKPSLFGSYEVVYVHYPGLPASPPAASSSASAIDDGPYSGHDNHGEAIKPLGVDVPRKKTDGIRQSLIAVIILSCFSAFVVCLGIIWLILLKYGACVKEREHLPQAIKSSPEKPSGRKPVDLSQPPGQENLVAWARPLLTATEGLETVIDPAIKSDVSFDSIAKVAAIASMCVQPEVSHRPFMGEVVQALKLVCNEFDEKKEVESKVCVQEDFPTTVDSLVSRLSSELVEASDTYHQVPGCDFSRGSNIALSASDFLSIPMGLEEQEPGSFRRHSCSGPVGTGRRSHFWQRIRSLSRGSRSEHGFSVKFWPGSR